MNRICSGMGYHRKKKGETPKSPPGWCTVSDQLISRSTSKAPKGHNNKMYKNVNPSGSNIWFLISLILPFNRLFFLDSSAIRLCIMIIRTRIFKAQRASHLLCLCSIFRKIFGVSRQYEEKADISIFII